MMVIRMLDLLGFTLRFHDGGQQSKMTTRTGRMVLF